MRVRDRADERRHPVNKRERRVDFLLTDMTQAAFWIAALKIIGINIILSGDNAVVIALACRMLPPKERFWGMVLGAGVAVFLRIVFTLVVAEAQRFGWSEPRAWVTCSELIGWR